MHRGMQLPQLRKYFSNWGGVSATLSTGRKRRRETISSYKRKRGSEFTASQNDPVTSGPWRLLETLCLVVCKELLVINELPRSSLNFSNLYNVIAESDKVKELSLTIDMCSRGTDRSSTLVDSSPLCPTVSNCAFLFILVFC